MTDDLPTRLRAMAAMYPQWGEVHDRALAAADEIERLRALVVSQDQMIHAQHERILELDPEHAGYYEQPLRVEVSRQQAILDVCDGLDADTVEAAPVRTSSPPETTMTDRLTDEQVALYANAVVIYPPSSDETSLTPTIKALAREVQEWRANLRALKIGRAVLASEAIADEDDDWWVMVDGTAVYLATTLRETYIAAGDDDE